MYKRLWIVSAVILFALAALFVMGLYSINTHANGLKAQRQASFLEVAENIRVDVNRKFNDFIKDQQAVPYTHYQHFYVPIASNSANAIVLSPLANKFENGLAKGYFQIEPDGKVLSPYQREYNGEVISPDNDSVSNQKMFAKVIRNNARVEKYLLPRLGENNGLSESLSVQVSKNDDPADKSVNIKSESVPQKTAQSKSLKARSRNYNIDSPDEQKKVMVLNTMRQNIEYNKNSNMIYQNDNGQQVESAQNNIDTEMQPQIPFRQNRQIDNGYLDSQPQTSPQQSVDFELYSNTQARSVLSQMGQSFDPFRDIVQVRIEPFTSVAVANSTSANSLFNGSVYMVRHINIEDKHLLQGFELDQDKLHAEISESALRLLRKYMSYEVAGEQAYDAMHAAILNFEFGSVVVNLFDKDLGAIGRQVGYIRNWFVAIVMVVSAATMFAILSLWRNIHAQLALARKKDDFISAVSHELRTPLTSIRMYTEMLEKDWVKTEAKKSEYYVTMRQESERLTRLIENVLDFSRIQRGRKKYNFKLGDINGCIKNVVEMMQPCAKQIGFVIEEQYCLSEDLQNTVLSFDSDAVTQVVINLVDNAIKYAKDAEDKRIIVRTRTENEYMVIEVEDHGPGIAMMQKKKIFEEFYRIGSESTRQTTGTGLGLALVKKFVEAHNGFIEVLSIRPAGVIFKVALPISNT